MTARAISATADLRDYLHAGIAVVLFDIRRHVAIDGREPTLDEAQALYLRWIAAGRLA